MNEQPNRRRRWITLLLMVLLLAGAATLASQWYLKVGQWRESTDNAYITGNLVPVSTRLAGTVVWIGTDENHYVEAGQLILRLEDSDERNEVQVLEQQLALAARTVSALREQDRSHATEVSQRQVTHELAGEEYKRRKKLADIAMVSDEELDAARTRSEETRIALDIAHSALAKSRLLSGDMSIDQHPRVKLAAARLRAAHLDLAKTRIVAPVDSHVARRSVQLGQRVLPGEELMSLAQLEAVWVEANFKENQLTHLHQGQPVTMTTDYYGEEQVFTGRLSGISPGTGAVFSLLPPQNATGNWIKIVQRVPVRIELDPGAVHDFPLPLGASLSVSVDTSKRDGPRLTRHTQVGTVAEVAQQMYESAELEATIAQIIADNLDGDGPTLSKR